MITRRTRATSVLREFVDFFAIEILELTDLLLRGRRRAEELRLLRCRLILQPGYDQVCQEESTEARELCELRVKIAALLGEVSACARCARGRPWPHGRWDGGFCCAGQTIDCFVNDELAALRAAGTRPHHLWVYDGGRVVWKVLRRIGGSASRAAREQHQVERSQATLGAGGRKLPVLRRDQVFADGGFNGNIRADCAFRGPHGCTLDARHRPNVCVWYVCDSLRRDLHERGDLQHIEKLCGELRTTFERFVTLRTRRLEEERFTEYFSDLLDTLEQPEPAKR